MDCQDVLESVQHRDDASGFRELQSELDAERDKRGASDNCFVAWMPREAPLNDRCLLVCYHQGVG